MKSLTTKPLLQAGALRLVEAAIQSGGIKFRGCAGAATESDAHELAATDAAYLRALFTALLANEEQQAP